MVVKLIFLMRGRWNWNNLLLMMRNRMVSMVVSMVDSTLHSFMVTSLYHLVTHLQEEMARQGTDAEKEYMQQK